MPKFKKGLAGIMAAAMLATAIGTPAAAFAATNKTTTATVKADDSNLTVTVPTVIPFTMGADGVLTSASEGALQIVNGSNFGIHVSGVSVAKQSPFNIVADAAKASEDNAVDFQFGVDSALIDAANPTAKAGSYSLAPHRFRRCDPDPQGAGRREERQGGHRQGQDHGDHHLDVRRR